MSNESYRARIVVIRPQAITDIEQQAQFLEENAPPETAVRFRISIVDAINRIAVQTYSGSPPTVASTLFAYSTDLKMSMKF